MAVWAILIWSSWARLGFFALVGPFFLYRTHIWSWPTLDVTNMQVMFVISWLLVTIERASSFGVTNLRCSPWPRTRRDKSSITYWSPFRVFHLQMWVLYGHLSHFGALEGSLSGFEQDMKKDVWVRGEVSLSFVGVAIILALVVWIERVDLLLDCRLCCVRWKCPLAPMRSNKVSLNSSTQKTFWWGCIRSITWYCKLCLLVLMCGHLCVHNENLAPMHASHPASLLLHGLL